MLRRVVVLGTGTEIGKTWLSSALARTAREQQLPVVALKPIETGLTPETLPTSDAMLLASASGNTGAHCYAFPDPITPWLAAERSGDTVDLARVARWVVTEEARVLGNTLHVVSLSIVETAGGVFSPITRTAANHELASHLDPARWLLVAPNRLGVLHDVVATVEAMQHRGRAPDCVVLNPLPAPDASTSSNGATLARLDLGCPVLEADPDPLRAGKAILDQLFGSAST